MSRRQPKLSVIALTLSILLAALPALAQGRSATAARGQHSSIQAADWVRLTWNTLSGLWGGQPAHSPTSIRGNEGGSLDPDGKPHAATTTAVTTVPSDPGGALHAHG